MKTIAVKLHERPASKINLIGGRLCLDFVNSMGARRTGPAGEMVIRDEKLNQYMGLPGPRLAPYAGDLEDYEIRSAAEKLVALAD